MSQLNIQDESGVGIYDVNDENAPPQNQHQPFAHINKRRNSILKPRRGESMMLQELSANSNNINIQDSSNSCIYPGSATKRRKSVPGQRRVSFAHATNIRSYEKEELEWKDHEEDFVNNNNNSSETDDSFNNEGINTPNPRASVLSGLTSNLTAHTHQSTDVNNNNDLIVIDGTNNNINPDQDDGDDMELTGNYSDQQFERDHQQFNNYNNNIDEDTTSILKRFHSSSNTDLALDNDSGNDNSCMDMTEVYQRGQIAKDKDKSEINVYENENEMEITQCVGAFDGFSILNNNNENNNSAYTYDVDGEDNTDSLELTQVQGPVQMKPWQPQPVKKDNDIAEVKIVSTIENDSFFMQVGPADQSVDIVSAHDLDDELEITEVRGGIDNNINSRADTTVTINLYDVNTSDNDALDITDVHQSIHPPTDCNWNQSNNYRNSLNVVDKSSELNGVNNNENTLNNTNIMDFTQVVGGAPLICRNDEFDTSYQKNVLNNTNIMDFTEVIGGEAINSNISNAPNENNYDKSGNNNNNYGNEDVDSIQIQTELDVGSGLELGLDVNSGIIIPGTNIVMPTMTPNRTPGRSYSHSSQSRAKARNQISATPTPAQTLRTSSKGGSLSVTGARASIQKQQQSVSAFTTPTSQKILRIPTTPNSYYNSSTAVYITHEEIVHNKNTNNNNSNNNNENEAWQDQENNGEGEGEGDGTINTNTDNISVEDFLYLAEIRFLDNISTRRRTTMGGGERGNAVVPVNEWSLEQKLIATSVLIPELEAIEKASALILANIEQVKQQTAEIEKQIELKNPQIFKYLKYGSTSRAKNGYGHEQTEQTEPNQLKTDYEYNQELKSETQTKLRGLKIHSRLEAKDQWNQMKLQVAMLTHNEFLKFKDMISLDRQVFGGHRLDLLEMHQSKINVIRDEMAIVEKDLEAQYISPERRVELEALYKSACEQEAVLKVNFHNLLKGLQSNKHEMESRLSSIEANKVFLENKSAQLDQSLQDQMQLQQLNSLADGETYISGGQGQRKGSGSGQLLSWRTILHKQQQLELWNSFHEYFPSRLSSNQFRLHFTKYKCHLTVTLDRDLDAILNCSNTNKEQEGFDEGISSGKPNANTSSIPINNIVDVKLHFEPDCDSIFKSLVQKLNVKSVFINYIGHTNNKNNNNSINNNSLSQMFAYLDFYFGRIGDFVSDFHALKEWRNIEVNENENDNKNQNQNNYDGKGYSHNEKDEKEKDGMYLKAVFIDASKGIKVVVKIMNLMDLILTKYGLKYCTEIVLGRDRISELDIKDAIERVNDDKYGKIKVLCESVQQAISG